MHFPTVSEVQPPPAAGPADYRIGIFAGDGCSHSWLWFVDTFERMGFSDLRPLSSSNIDDGRLDDCDVLAVSGGDTFAIAEGLGASGARRIREFIEKGGLYIGSCAGAYLVMNSSKPHLNLFNFAAVKITNLNRMLPECRRLPHKFSVCYGCDYIFHPVRGAVALELTGAAFGRKGERMFAPLYGGPGMIVSGSGQILARYAGFTAKTQYLVDRELARSTLVGYAAAVRTSLEKGVLYLFGPHFEHPHFHAANKMIAQAVVSDAPRRTAGRRRPPAPGAAENDAIDRPGGWLRDLKRELSNSRIVAAGLEMRPARWLIGAKFYEPEKIRVFIESMWKRLPAWEKSGAAGCLPDLTEPLVVCAAKTTIGLRRLKQALDEGCDTQLSAEHLFELLNRLTRAFFELYFQSRSPSGSPHPDGSIRGQAHGLRAGSRRQTAHAAAGSR